MKPSWDDAPEWATWLARNDAGDWFWFETEPGVNSSGDFFGGGRVRGAGSYAFPIIKEPRP